MLFEYLLNEGQGPEAENILAAYESSRFFHARLNQRAPDAIYKLSLRQVWPAFASAMDAAEYIVQERPFLTLHDRLWQDTSLQLIEHLLYVLVEHLEECELILKACFSDPAVFQKNEHVKRYRKVTRPYRDRIAGIVNAIKHNQARLRLFALHGDNFVAPGYFVEGVLPGDVIGPNPNIHNNESSLAFSFAFDLRLHFLCIFLVARNITRAVEKILGPADGPPHASASSSHMRDLGRRLAAFPRFVFPDEMKQGFPEVSVREDQQVLVIDYPGPTPPETIASGMVRHWVSFDVADGTAGAFLPPYASAAQRPFTVQLVRSFADPKNPRSSGGG